MGHKIERSKDEVKEKGKSRDSRREPPQLQGKQSEKGLENELETLRASLQQARQAMLDGSEDPAKMGALVARLSDSIGRALLNEQKLRASGDKAAFLRSEVDRILREVGLGD